MRVSVPVTLSIINMARLFAVLFATYRKLPDGSTLRPMGEESPGVVAKIDRSPVTVFIW
jgi:hypothetical protein